MDHQLPDRQAAASEAGKTPAPSALELLRAAFSFYTNDCTSKHPSVKLLEFTDDTTVIALIWDRDESAYRQEVEQLTVWCSHNNLELNTLKTAELIVDFKRNPPALLPTHHHGQHCGCSGVIQVPGNHHLSGREVGPRQLKKFYLPQAQMTRFYSAVRTAERITSVHLPNLQDLYNSRVKKWAGVATANHLSPPIPIFCILNPCTH
ncbi:hypothetical protein QTP70_004238 [Hemibagrus guttatus]|uniref:Reverse transcriptase domain-containing protein n=1 Tax=Hemibagrus guttatus TaxID=175788 RepID=A0AAE0PVJ3_9TELE|nr:hypothetical protein QTP70_004238 [Hemibagrus guttatus]